ncbi:MAG: glycosyltransferase family 39 protein [Deltaproteobacteria bacterium]
MKLNSPLRELSVIIIVTIIGTFFLAYAAFVLLEDTFPDSVISIWNTWDTQHYLDIAQYGYTNSAIDEKKLQIVFFPLYPFIIKIFSFAFKDYLFSALLVSNIAYAGAVVYLFKLVRIDYDDDDALRAGIYISIFPTAYFFHAPYTESLFLVFTVASLYYARRSKWALSGTAGMLAAATRITGIILLPVLVIEYLYQNEYKIKNTRKEILWLGAVGLGLLFYLVINYVTFGDPFKFLEFQKGHWSKELALPIKGFFSAWSGIFWRKPADALLGGWAEIIFAALGLILIIYSFFRLRLSYGVYALLTWLTVTSTSFWLSIPRYTLSIFPIFIALSILGRRKEVNYLIIFLSLVFYALFLSLFIRFRWAF